MDWQQYVAPAVGVVTILSFIGGVAWKGRGLLSDNREALHSGLEAMANAIGARIDRLEEKLEDHAKASTERHMTVSDRIHGIELQIAREEGARRPLNSGRA